MFMMKNKGSSPSINLVSRDERESSIESGLSELKEEEFEKLPRIVEKDGTVNVVNKPKGRWFEMYDYSLLLRIQWVSFIVISVLAFVLSYAFFAMFLYFTHIYNFEKPSNVTNAKNESIEDKFYEDNDPHMSIRRARRKRDKCYAGIDGFGDAFLFSLETMTTIGYGTKYPNPWCPDVIVFVMALVWCSIILTSVFSGIFLAKFTVRTGTSKVRFSSKVCISKRNDDLFLMMRISDPMASGEDLVEVNAFACMNRKVDCDDQAITSRINLLHIGSLSFSYTMYEGGNTFPLMWPLVIFHKIDQDSPLYKLDHKDLIESKLEIIVKVSGDRTGTGGTIFSSTSYINDEIVWGARFNQDCVMFRHRDHNIASTAIDDIDRMIEDQTPPCSAFKLDERKNSSQLQHN